MLFCAANHVVEQIDPKNFGRFAELASDLDVGGAGSGVAAWVVVDADDGGGALTDCFAEDFPRVNETVARGAGGDFAFSNQAVFAVEAKGPEFFDFETVGIRKHVLVYEVGTVEDRLGDGGAVADSAADFDDGDEL